MILVDLVKDSKTDSLMTIHLFQVANNYKNCL